MKWFTNLKNRLFPKNVVRPRYVPFDCADPDVMLPGAIFEVFSRFMETLPDGDFGTINLGDEDENVLDLWWKIYHFYHREYQDYLNHQGKYGELLYNYLNSRENEDKEEEEAMETAVEDYEKDTESKFLQYMVILCMTYDRMYDE